MKPSDDFLLKRGGIIPYFLIIFIIFYEKLISIHKRN